MSTQQNPTLIPGFEDIMRHIRQQEDHIKKLEDTVKNCGENYKKLYQEHVDLQEVQSLLQPFENTETFRMKVEEMKKENQELKAVKEYLEHEVTRYSNALEEEYVLKSEYDELEAENKKLKEDLEKAWDQRGDKWRKARIKKLDEENKNLQAQIKNLEAQIKNLEALIKEHEERRDLSDQLNYELNVLLEENKHDLEQACEVAGWSPTSSKEPVKKD